MVNHFVSTVASTNLVQNLIIAIIIKHVLLVYHSSLNVILLGCNVGTGCAKRSSLSICSNVVLPALSKPRNSSLPDFFHSPVKHTTQNKILLTWYGIYISFLYQLCYQCCFSSTFQTKETIPCFPWIFSKTFIKEITSCL